MKRMGEQATPIRRVPRAWMRKRRTRSPQEMPTIDFCTLGAATAIPATAEVTDTAVMWGGGGSAMEEGRGTGGRGGRKRTGREHSISDRQSDSEEDEDEESELDRRLVKEPRRCPRARRRDRLGVSRQGPPPALLALCRRENRRVDGERSSLALPRPEVQGDETVLEAGNEENSPEDAGDAADDVLVGRKRSASGCGRERSARRRMNGSRGGAAGGEGVETYETIRSSCLRERNRKSVR